MHQHSSDVSAFAEATGIDLPSINSVLVGVMTLREAVSIQGRSVEDQVEMLAVAERATTGVVRELLRAASRARFLPPRLQRRVQRRSESPRLILTSIALLSAAFAIGMSGWNNWMREVAESRALEQRHDRPEVGAASSRPVHTTRIRRDASGQILQISDTTPEGVLRAFAGDSVHGQRYQAIEVAATEPFRRGVRLGVVRDYHDLAAPRAIWIQLQRRNHRWVTGDGKSPVEAMPVAYERAGKARIRLAP